MRVPPAALRVGAVAGAAALAWAVLLAGMPAGVTWLCGADGLVASVAAWDFSRLGTLMLMWAVMMAAMVLPCVAMSLVLREWPHPHPGFAHLLPSREKGQGTNIAVLLPSPSMGEGALQRLSERALLGSLGQSAMKRADEGGAAITIISFLVLTLGAALLHWGLESASLLGSAEITAFLLAALLLIELRKWTSAATPILAALQMVCLQLLVDPMSVGWMAVVLLWMLADLLLPDRAKILSGIQRLRRHAIVPLRALH